MQRQLQTLDLTQREVTVPEALASAIVTLRDRDGQALRTVDLTTGWTPAYSLDQTEARAHGRFPDLFRAYDRCPPSRHDWSWTENWPYEPLVGNTPTTNTFMWTWASFCFTFFAFGGVLFIYQHWLSGADEAPMDPVLVTFRPLTDSQRKIGKYFLVVAAVLLLQIPAGTIMAHAYYDRPQLLRPRTATIPAVQLPAGRAHPGADHLDRRRRGSAPVLFLAPAIAGGREARGQGLLVDLLFYVTLIIVAGALVGDWLGIMGHMEQRSGSGSATRGFPTSSWGGSGKSAFSSVC